MAENGRQALLATGACSFDLMLMDCQMPEMDGLTATSEIRQRETGAGQRLPPSSRSPPMPCRVIANNVSAGMDDYLTKPLHANAIADRRAEMVETNNGTDRVTRPSLHLNAGRHTGAGLFRVSHCGRHRTHHGSSSLDGIRALQRPKPACIGRPFFANTWTTTNSVDALRDTCERSRWFAAVAHRLQIKQRSAWCHCPYGSRPL